MKATLIYHEKYVYADGAIREMILWQHSGKTEERPHGMTGCIMEFRMEHASSCTTTRVEKETIDTLKAGRNLIGSEM